MTSKAAECNWTFDSVEWESNKWDSDCGESFTFEVGGPEENKMRFCCYCGLRLIEVIKTGGYQWEMK